MVALCLAAEPAAGRAQSAGHDPPEPLQRPEGAELVFLAVSINGAPQEGDYLVARQVGNFFFRSSDLTRWHIRFPRRRRSSSTGNPSSR
ncbi:hypothetical protein [Sphingomonas alpina]|uniref:hypothetical protein n=1 Tax=Sphingomonas alpina TaxID=653931 RepID=UPI001E5609DA|nr:hypothetical protein [Sphingomonas alpina]